MSEDAVTKDMDDSKDSLQTNIQGESPDCCDTSAFSFNIRTLSSKETQKIDSLNRQDYQSHENNVEVLRKIFKSFEELPEKDGARIGNRLFLSRIKNKISRLSSLRKGYGNNYVIPRDIIGVNTKYFLQFSAVSFQLEKWSAQRRKTMRLIESCERRLEQIRRNCSKGRLAFSAVDIACIVGSSILDSLNVSWSPKVLFTSTAFGCLSLMCSLFEMSERKTLLEDVLKALNEDKSLQRTLEISFYKMRGFDRSVNELFPHGVDGKIVDVLLKDEGDSKKLCGIEELLHVLPSSTPNKRIWLAVLLSNAINDLKLLEDVDFLAKVDTFSKSRVAEIWWKRMQCQDFPSVPKSEQEEELKSSFRPDSMPLHAVPVMSLPFWYGTSLQTVGTVLSNGLVVYDACCQLSGNERSREADALRDLKKNLQQEHDEIMGLYEKLDPHYD